MNKMDDFFRKALTDHNVDSDGWNIPDEQVWLKAKDSFPQEKRKRRAFWLPLFGVLLLTTVAAWGVYSHRTSDSHRIAVEESSLPLSQIENTAEIVSTDQGTALFTEEIRSEELSNGGLAKSPSQSDQKSDNSKVPARLTEEIKITKSTIAGSITKDAPLAKTSQTVTTINTAPTTEIAETSSPSLASGASTNDLQVTAPSQAQLQNSADSTFLAVDNSSLIPASSKRDYSPALSMLDNRINLLPAHLRQEDLHIATIEIPRPQYPLWEIGLKYLLLPISLIDELDLEDDDGDFVNLLVNRSRGSGLNLSVHRWLGARWSLQSGLMASRFTLSSNACLQTGLSTDDLGMIESGTKFALSRSSALQVNPDQVQLLPGVELAEGDQLKIQGILDLSVRSINIPIILNRHWARARGHEYHAGLGIGLGIYKLAQEEMELTFFRESQLVAEPYLQAEEIENKVDLFVFLQGGMRYPISKKLFAAVNLRLLLTDPLLSGLDVGVHYRWHR